MSPNKGSGTAVVVGVGAERGLGAALCRRFGAEGYHVLVAGRTPEKLAQVVKTICATGGSADAITVDTTREDDVIRLFDGAMSPHNGRAAADVVIFNAGNNRRIDFKELSAEQFEEFWRIGCFGGFLVGREAARRLAPLGRGTIIFTGASASLRGKPGFAHFAAAKADLDLSDQKGRQNRCRSRQNAGHIVRALASQASPQYAASRSRPEFQQHSTLSNRRGQAVGA